MTPMAVLRTTVAVLTLSLPAAPTYGFACLETNGHCLHWPQGGTSLRASLNSAGILANADQQALEAANEWNSAGAVFHFTVLQTQDQCAAACTTAPGQPCAGSPGSNPVMFCPSACGGNFGDIVAQTNTCERIDTGEIINAPVFVNSTAPWLAYDGPLVPPFNDIHRVLLHEFGHVLGLDHPDDHGQTVNAIMNGQESNTYTLQEDDLTGIRSLYPNTAANGAQPSSGCHIGHARTSCLGWLLLLPAVAAMRRRPAVSGQQNVEHRLDC